MFRLIIKISLLILLNSISFKAIAQERPNFVFVLTDDQSYGLMGCTGNQIVQTPNLDQLAKDGILFDNAHITSAICTPSRISILLSQFERKHGVNFNSGTSVSEDAWEQSYPMVMKKAGYYTGWVGKNHAPVGKGGYESGLMEKSFDYWYAGHGHLSFYPKDKHKIFNDAIAHTQAEVIKEGMDDFLDPNERKLKGAIRFLEDRPANQPFLLSINFNIPHSNGTASMKLKPEDDEIYKSLYRDVAIPLPPNYIAKKDIKNPKLPTDLLKAENRQIGYDFVDSEEQVRERYIRQLQAMTGVDRLMGNLRKKLYDLDLADNTVIIFTSDHGLFMGEQGLGGKALCYEKTTHVPLIVMDPSLPKDKKGKRSDALAQSIDIAPTMLAKAGIAIPNSFQGKDLSPLINGDLKPVRDYIFTENLWSTTFGNPRCDAVQNQEWKYIRYYKNDNFPALKNIAIAKEFGFNANKLLYGVHDADIATYRSLAEGPLSGEPPVYEELYHLQTDPTELNNLINKEEYAAILKQLKAAWKSEIQAARGAETPKVLRYTVDSQAEEEKKKKAKSLKNKKQIAPPTEPDQPNIVWLVTEDNSKHFLKLYEEGGASMPNVEALAQKGIVFNHAFSNAPVCSVARSTLISGCYAPRVGTQYHRKMDLAPMPDGVEMFPAYLRTAGYYTTNNNKEDYNFIKSEGVWDESSKKATYKNRKTNQPFFHVQNFGTTHEGKLHFTKEQMQNSPTQTSPESIEPFPYHPNTPTYRYTYAQYHDLHKKADAEIGQFLQQLETDGLMENTIIFYYGDHGGVLPRSKGYIYESGLHVPLVVYFPEKWQHLAPVKMGSRTDAFVQFIDFAPTVLNLAGAPIPDEIDGQPFLGKNIIKADLAKRNTAFSYADRFDEKYDLVRGLRKGKYKYLRNYQPFNIDALFNFYRYKMQAFQEWETLYKAGKLSEPQKQFFQIRTPEALYDLKNDPHEVHNLAANPAYQATLASLRQELQEQVQAMPDLSFYPEPYFLENGLSNPVQFGQQHKKEIGELVEIADLSLLSFKKAKKGIKKALKSNNPWKRYWGLIACSSLGKSAAPLYKKARKIAAKDTEKLVQLRALEFLALNNQAINQEDLLNILRKAETKTEANLILNTVALLKTLNPALNYHFPKSMFDQDWVKKPGDLVNRRVDFINAEQDH